MAAPMKWLSANLNLYHYVKTVLFQGIRQTKRLTTYASFSSTKCKQNAVCIRSAAANQQTSFYKTGILVAGMFGFFEKKKDDAQEDAVILKLKMAKLSERKKNFEEAEACYHEALEILIQRKNKKEITQEDWVLSRNYVYDSMANLAFNMKKFEKAEKLFKDTMKGLMEAGVEKDDNSIVEISLKLAMIYALLKRDGEASQGYRFCINTMEKKLNKDTDQNSIALLGLSLDSFARYLLLRDYFEESLKYMEWSLDLAIRVFGESHPQPLVIMNDIATVCMMKKDYDSAMKYINRAIRIGKEIDSPDIAAFYCNLGAIYLHKQQTKEAEQYCDKAVTLGQKMGDKQSVLHGKSCLEEVKKRLSRTNTK